MSLLLPVVIKHGIAASPQFATVNVRRVRYFFLWLTYDTRIRWQFFMTSRAYFKQDLRLYKAPKYVHDIQSVLYLVRKVVLYEYET